MNRQSARENVATLLTGLGTYALVSDGARRKLGGVSPVAIVLSKGTQVQRLTRSTSNDLNVHTLSLTLYVRCDDGSEASCEDTLDQLVIAACAALDTAGYLVGASDSAPEGNPLRIIDGVFYRQEVIPVTFEEYL